MNLKDCYNVEDFRKLAKKKLPSPIFHYIDGGSDDEFGTALARIELPAEAVLPGDSYRLHPVITDASFRIAEAIFQDEDADQIHNILLEGGDVIFIPEIRQTVNVSGQVIKAGLVNFEEGRRVAYYLSQVGGYAFKADKRGARLIRARTGQRERLDNNALVEAGDEIWIPETAYRDWWNIFQSTMRTFAEAAAILVLARSM